MGYSDEEQRSGAAKHAKTLGDMANFRQAEKSRTSGKGLAEIG